MAEPGMVVHTCDPSTWEVEAGGSGIQDLFELYSEFKSSLSNTVEEFQSSKMAVLIKTHI